MKKAGPVQIKDSMSDSILQINFKQNFNAMLTAAGPHRSENDSFYYT